MFTPIILTCDCAVSADGDQAHHVAASLTLSFILSVLFYFSCSTILMKGYSHMNKLI